MILRLIRNLIFSYQKIGDTEKENELEQMLKVLSAK
jgi:hypothetical protein